jgi:hypothetical protein
MTTEKESLGEKRGIPEMDHQFSEDHEAIASYNTQAQRIIKETYLTESFENHPQIYRPLRNA